jgi:cytochrome c-type biogenesis protein CcmH
MNNINRNKIIGFLLASFMICFFFLPHFSLLAAAQAAPPSDDDVNRIASQLFCPVCENVPLDECQTAACDQWRELIRQKLAEGWSDQEIKDYFVTQYGDRVLGAPPRRGANWLLYVLPPLVFLAGLGLILARFHRHSGPPLGAEKQVTDPYLAKVEQDLKEIEEV